MASFYLLVFMLLMSFQALLNAFDTRAFFVAYPHLSRISWLLPSLFGPLVYLIVRKMTRPSEGLRGSDSFHFLPFVGYVALLSPWFFQAAASKVAQLRNFELHSLEDFGYLNQLSILLILAYCLLAMGELASHKRRLEGHFSEIEGVRLRWLQQFMYALIGILAISVLGFYGRKWGIPHLTNIYHYNYALVVLLLYWIAYKWATYRGLAIELPEEVPKRAPRVSKYARSGLNETTMDAIFGNLERLMIEEKPFLRGNLTLHELADRLEVKRHHLSQVINEKTGQRFYDYINAYRVRELKGRISDPGFANRSYLGLALDCGFNSKATFNAAFKKHTGKTPSAYHHLKKKEV